MASLPVINVEIVHADEQAKLEEFLTKFSGKLSSSTDDASDVDMGDEEDGGLDDDNTVIGTASKGTRLKYMDQLRKIAQREQDLLVIDLEDIRVFQNTVGDLVDKIRKNTRRYLSIAYDAVDKLIPEPIGDISHKDDVIDTLIHHRVQRTHENEDRGEVGFPKSLLRRYELFFRPLLSDPPLAVRDVRGHDLGRLITMRGIVTRISEVKPLMAVICYSCDSCGADVFQDIANKQFTPLTDCISDDCLRDNRKGTLHMQTRACRFRPFQEVKFQEMTDQVPVGHIPRSMTAHVYGPLSRQMNPGDVIHLGGIFLPTPYTGFQAIRAGLLQDSYLEVHHIHQVKRSYTKMEITPEIEQELTALQQDDALYEKLATSIAPEIFGHLDVKKALLLLLVGGVTKNLRDGMKIRGDINVCLMGDPGVAKSQLLKYISKVAPRGVYTTGKGSSGVGLTAAVMRDPVTDEMVLEGGALVLADNGICCIDEFDKMEESDRTAIHEVMEQQTISISKAGITTTLNARTSVLAAANPLYGRYNPKISPVENINLPAALLSRFDVMFLILDKPSRENDEELARHVTHVHMFNRHPGLSSETVSPDVIRHYIAKARSFRPTVPPEVSQYVVESYVQLRKQHVEQEKEKTSFTHTSARTLLAILRLAQALARLRWSNEVVISDVDEALRLMQVSKESLIDENDRDRDSDNTDTSKIFRLIKTMAREPRSGRHAHKRRKQTDRSTSHSGESDEDDENHELPIVDIRARVLAQGFTESQLMDTILRYEELEIWTRVANHSRLRFVGGDAD